MSQVVSKDGTVIAYEKNGQGPTVILIDGAMGHRGHFGGRPLAAELSRDFTVIVYDRRGRGESTDTQPYSVDKEIDDIEALIDIAETPANLYGFSSGAVLALCAAARLGNKVAKLAVLEPPFGGDEEKSKEEARKNLHQLTTLLKAGKNSDAVAFFLRDMVPPEMLEGMKQSPGWASMVAVAPTLAYDYQVLGDGAIPRKTAAVIDIPTLILDGEKSPAFKHTAADTLARSIKNSQRKTFQGQMTNVPAAVLAPELRKFFE
jgi:pimeloyl-ACP methyl ester carboxylesterase